MHVYAQTFSRALIYLQIPIIPTNAFHRIHPAFIQQINVKTI